MTEFSNEEKFLLSVGLTDLYINIMNHEKAPPRWMTEVMEILERDVDGTLKRVYELQKKIGDPIEMAGWATTRVEKNEI